MADVDPPAGFTTEVRCVLEPVPFSAKAFAPPSLLAGEVHAFLARRARGTLGERMGRSTVKPGRRASAMRLLRSSDLDVVEIALASGFQNLSHFYHLFEAHYQIPPNHYRNRELSIIRADNGRGAR